MQPQKTYYLKQGSTFWVTDSQNIDIHDRLPPATFVVLHDPMKGFFLSQVERMTVPKKIYGHTEHQVERIYKTFSSRDRNTGVLLNGEKGAGKTLTLALLAHQFMNNNLPVIIINSAFSGDQFNAFISGISQPCMIAFDEFDKTYDNDDQTKILTLLDGVFNSTKLFVLTCNDSWKVNGFMLNRPGRIFYNLSYKRLDESAIREYCADVLKNQKETEGVVVVAGTIDAFNFDMLKALVEEMNRFNESASQSVKLLNIRPERSAYVNYVYVVSRKDGDGAVVCNGEIHNSIIPMSGKPFGIQIETPNPKFNKDDPECYEDDVLYTNVVLTPKECVKLDASGYIFEKDGWIINIVKQDTSVGSYTDYF